MLSFTIKGKMNQVFNLQNIVPEPGSGVKTYNGGGTVSDPVSGEVYRIEERPEETESS